MNKIDFHITTFIIYLSSFAFLLFCQPHKKVTKSRLLSGVTTGHNMRFSVFSIILLTQTRMFHTPVDGHPLVPLCEKYRQALHCWNSITVIGKTLPCAMAVHGLCEIPTVRPLLTGLVRQGQSEFLNRGRFFLFLGGAKKKIKK